MFVSMGGFMAAAANAVTANNRNARKRAERDAELTRAAYAQDEAVRRFGEEQDAKRLAARVQAEKALGREETDEERVAREIRQFGYSMTSR